VFFNVVVLDSGLVVVLVDFLLVDFLLVDFLFGILRAAAAARLRAALVAGIRFPNRVLYNFLDLALTRTTGIIWRPRTFFMDRLLSR